MEAENRSERWAWADVAKGLGMLLVLVGHSPGLGDEARTIIYAFHMPLFFFVSGALVRPGRRVPLAEFARDQGRRLLVPYLVFSALSYPIWLLALAAGRSPSAGVTAATPLVGTLYGIGANGWLDHNVALWFFPCLFATRLLYAALERAGRAPLVALLVVLSGIAGVWLSRTEPFRLPWGTDVALVAVAFFGTGALLRRWSPQLGIGRAALAASSAAGFALSFALARWNGRVDMNGNGYRNPLLFFVAAAAGIVAVLALARLLERSRWLAHLGRNSSGVFPLHIPLFTLFTGIAVVALRLPQSFNDGSSLLGVAYALLAAVLLVPAGDGIRARAPWLLGEVRR